MKLSLLIFLPLCCSVVFSTDHRRKGRQWVGEMETARDCTFPITERNNATPSSSADKVALCNFTLSGPVDGVYPFRKGLASLATWLGGPTTDASNSTDGGYVFFETSSLSVQQLPGVHAKAWLKTPVYRATTPNGQCLKFSYNIQGVSAAELKLLRVQLVPLESQMATPLSTSPLIVNSILLPTVPAQARVPEGAFASPWTPYRAILANQTGWQEVVDEVWLSSDSTRGKWRQGHVTYSSPYPHAFIFEALPDLAHLQYRGHIALDDIKFSTGPCDVECEFNADFCQWSSSIPEADFEWSLSRGSLWTHTGPIRDQLSSKNNFNFGGYAYIDSRLPHFPGSRAVLKSSPIPPNAGPKCFNFWVHMFGAGIGQLRMVQKSSNLSGTEEIWRLEELGPRDTWYKAQVTLASSSPFTIQLEATVGDSGYGDIAVDSFRIQDGPCPILPERAMKKSPDCTFEHGQCGWVVTNSQPGLTSMWARSSEDVFAGRPAGHSLENVQPRSINNYMFFDTSQNGYKPGSRGYLSSQLEGNIQPQCISFWAYMASSSLNQPRLGALEVILFEPNSTTNITNQTSGFNTVTSTTLWRVENHQEEKWFFGQVSFTAIRGGYVTFAGIRGEGVRGIIALDDITLYRGPCPTLPAEASVSPLDCSFDLNLCKWSVDSKPFIGPMDDGDTEAPVADVETIHESSPTSTSTESTPASFPTTGIAASTTTTAESTSTSTTTTETTSTSSTTAEATSNPTALTEISSTSSITTETTISSTSSPEEASAVSSTSETTSTIGTAEETSPSSSPARSNLEPSTTLIVSAVETSKATLDSEGTPSTTEYTTPDGTDSVAFDSVLLSTELPSLTETETPSTIPTTITTPLPTTTMTTNPPTTKESSNRGVAELFDEISSYGANTIEVISTSRNGGTKSIIISQPGRTIRMKRSGNMNDEGWVGYNKPAPPRNPKIVSHRKSTSGEDPVWQRPLPLPHWLRGRHPTGEADGRGHISAHSFRPLSFHPSTSQPKLFSVSTHPSPSVNRPFPARDNKFPSPRVPVESPTLPSAIRPNTTRWNLSGSASSLNHIRDHTFQLAEGGYVFMDGNGKSGSIVSRLFSPEFSGNSTFCLSFFFTMAHENNSNATLTVYRQTNAAIKEVWRVTSGALDRSEFRYKSTWILAKVPIPSNGSLNQNIVIEGLSEGGGIAIDDIRLQNVSCSARP